MTSGRAFRADDIVVEQLPPSNLETARRADFVLESIRLSSCNDDLMTRWPDEWVAFDGDDVIHARQLDELLAMLRAAGFDPACKPVRFLSRIPPQHAHAWQ